MKKMMNVLTVFVLLGAMIPLAFADEPGTTLNEVDIDAETQQQTELMTNELGSEIRFLQLEKAVITNINTGEEIISFLKESDVNTIDLQVILAEFELLLDDVQNADPNASDAVSIFVDLKHDAVNLSTEFRETVNGLPNSNLLDQIQQRTRNMICNQTRNISHIIQNKIVEYNSNRFRNLFQHLGENGSGYIHKYQNGSMMQNQVRQNITMKINQSAEDEQFTFLTTLKQQKIKNQIQTQHRIQNATEGFQQRQENRLEHRLQRADNLSDNSVYQQLTERIQNKLKTIRDTNDDGESGHGTKPKNGEDNGYGEPNPGNNDNGQTTPGDKHDTGSQNPNGGGS